MFHFLIRSFLCAAFLFCTNGLVQVKDYIHFQFYTGPTVQDYIRLPYSDGLNVKNLENFHADYDTVFYFPGWTERPSQNEESVNTIAAAFLTKKASVNLIVLDYAELVQGYSLPFYIESVYNITDVGQAIGQFLEIYIGNVQPVEKVRLVGHSLGSQVVSRTANVYGPGRLKHITALDPAGPVFNLPNVMHLDKDDAEFVVVIHTDGGFFGDGRSIGHVDFYPNLGVRVQPYCSEHGYPFCSHHMSWRYYAATIINEKIFPAKQCEGGPFCSFGEIYCNCQPNSSVIYMGYNVNTLARGNYYMKTRAEPPFGLGEAGFYF